MGLHTWFAKSAEKYNELENYYNKLTAYDQGSIHMEQQEVDELLDYIETLEEFDNSTEFHDVFRTNKKNADNTYTSETISSLEDSLNWIENIENKVHYKHIYTDSIEQELEYKVVAIKHLKEFWSKYPKGIIYFL